MRRYIKATSVAWNVRIDKNKRIFMKTKVAIIGCGQIAPTHIESYQVNPDVEIYALCDIIKERAAALAERYGIRRIVTDAKEIFANDEIDAVDICTPHFNHAELCIEALEAGKDVICEKPLANTMKGLNLLRRAERDYPERIFAGIFQHRYNPIFKLVRALVEEGAFGQLLTASMQHRCLRAESYYKQDAWRGTKKYERGGVLINQAIHYLDLFQWIMGGVSDVQGFYANLTHQGIIETEDTIVGAVRFKCGAFGTIEATNSARLGWDTQLHIVGTKGDVSIVGGVVTRANFDDEGIIKRLDEAKAELDTNIAGKVGKSHYGYGHPVQIADFIDCVRTRRRPFVTATDAADAAKLTLALYKASEACNEEF